MSESAVATRATERRQATASRLTALCRRLTAERGLNGFTIEEVCSEVGVSRRTFFNYFPSKEDAVFGIGEVEELSHFADLFLGRGSRGWSAVIDDLAEFTAHFIELAGVDAADHLEFMRVLDREPRLLARFIGMGRERELALVALVAQRESVAADDLRARAVVDIFSSAMRSTAERLSEPSVAANFGGALIASLTALRAVLAPTEIRKATA